MVVWFIPVLAVAGIAAAAAVAGNAITNAQSTGASIDERSKSYDSLIAGGMSAGDAYRLVYGEGGSSGSTSKDNGGSGLDLFIFGKNGIRIFEDDEAKQKALIGVVAVGCVGLGGAAGIKLLKKKGVI